MPTLRVPTTRQARQKSSVPSMPAAKGAGKRGSIAKMASEASPRDAVDPAVKRAMIAEAAYFRAEQRGFALGYELQDWLDAEAQVEALLRS